MADIQPSLRYKYSKERPALSLQQLSINPAIQHQLVDHLYNSPQHSTLNTPRTTLDEEAMKLSLAILACIATSAIAGPVKFSRSTFSDPTCKLSKAVTPGTPLSVLFPVANLLGSIVGPTVKALIGADNEEKLDKLADNLCINSQQEPAGQRGICAELLQAVRDFAAEPTPAGKVHQYNCLLNLLCVARAGTLDGTCQYLLAGADCVANRILQTKDLECEKTKE